MGKGSEITDIVTEPFLTTPMLFVHTLSIKVLLLEENLVGLVIV